MTITSHVRAFVVISFLGVFLSFFGLGFSILVYFRTVPTWLQLATLGLSVVIGYYVVYFIFSRLIGAVCPKCNKSVFLRVSRDGELTYNCQARTYSHETGIFERGST